MACGLTTVTGCPKLKMKHWSFRPYSHCKMIPSEESTQVSQSAAVGIRRVWSRCDWSVSMRAASHCFKGTSSPLRAGAPLGVQTLCSVPHLKDVFLTLPDLWPGVGLLAGCQIYVQSVSAESSINTHLHGSSQSSSISPLKQSGACAAACLQTERCHCSVITGVLDCLKGIVIQQLIAQY